MQLATCERKFFKSWAKKTHIAGNLARYMFDKSARSSKIDPTELFFKLAAFVYSGGHQDESTKGTSTETSSGTQQEVEEFDIDNEETEILDI